MLPFLFLSILLSSPFTCLFSVFLYLSISASFHFTCLSITCFLSIIPSLLFSPNPSFCLCFPPFFTHPSSSFHPFTSLFSFPHAFLFNTFYFQTPLIIYLSFSPFPSFHFFHFPPFFTLFLHPSVSLLFTHCYFLIHFKFLFPSRHFNIFSLFHSVYASNLFSLLIPPVLSVLSSPYFLSLVLISFLPIHFSFHFLPCMSFHSFIFPFLHSFVFSSFSNFHLSVLPHF